MDWKYLRNSWRERPWISFRIPLLMVWYAVFSLLNELINFWTKAIPQRFFHFNVIILILNAIYCGLVYAGMRTEYHFCTRKYLQAKRELEEKLNALKAERITPAVVELSTIVNYNIRPGVDLLAYAATVIYQCRELKLPCVVEIALIESWIRYWEEEIVSR